MAAVRQWVMAQMARPCARFNAGLPRRKSGRKRRNTSMTVVPMRPTKDRPQRVIAGGYLTGQLATELLHQRAAVLLAAVGQVHVDHGGVDALVAQQGLDGVDRRARLG